MSCNLLTDWLKTMQGAASILDDMMGQKIAFRYIAQVVRGSAHHGLAYFASEILLVQPRNELPLCVG